MEGTSGSVGYIEPTFDEYPGRVPNERRMAFFPGNADFSYTATDIINYFGDKNISSLIVINPDNPTGNYIGKGDMFTLLGWAARKGVLLIVDESFMDFADGEPYSLIDDNILTEHKNLVVVKSISKSYGVPGLRLGVLASSDEAFINRIKKDVAIWNINAVAEFYMQIEEKYGADYENSLEQRKEARNGLAEGLASTGGLRVIPSQANFLMAEVTAGITSRALARELLCGHNLLIKDVTPKVAASGRRYIRVAVRTDDDNDRLISAMRDVFSKNIQRESDDE
jgi:histidinol-phosphate/aromatic aminotransferase/cobyric acid decarboxylase-like protein